MYVIFENEGEIDIRALKTFGVSVKENENPIGFFGTGLKYALAILLRTGHEISVQSGQDVYEFATQREEIRGDVFDLVTMRAGDGGPQELGFTTQVGKTWEAWMAYRELYCNCRDEHGQTYEASEAPQPKEGFTRVVVRGEAIQRAHIERSDFVLEGKPLQSTSIYEVYPGESRGVFYRGLKVMKVPNGKKTLYTYNLLYGIDLTEDRTAKYPFIVDMWIRDAILESENETLVRGALLASKAYHENSFDFRESRSAPSEVFMRLADELVRDRACDVNGSALSVYKAHARKLLTPDTVPLTSVQSEMLQRAQAFSASIGFKIGYPVIVTESLGEGVLGMAEDGRIYLSSHCFLLGTKQVAATLIEEHVHLKHQLHDCSRPLQDFLLNKIVSLGEEIQGEPL